MKNTLFFPIRSLFYKPVELLLRARLHIVRAASHDDQFLDLWRLCIRFKWLFALKEHYFNPLRIPWQNLLFGWLLQIVKLRNPNYKPKITALGNELILDMYNANINIIIISIHTELHEFIVRFLEDAGVKCSIIVDEKIVEQEIEANNFGFPGEVDLLYRSHDVFLKARRKLRNGKIVLLNIDYLSYKTNQTKKYISTAIFDFAKKIGANIFYVLPHVSDIGRVVIDFSPPHVIEKSVSSTDMAHDFICFINSNSKNKENWNIKQWEGEEY